MCTCHHRCWQQAFVELVTPSEPVARMDPRRNLERFSRWLSPDSATRETVAEVDGDVVAYTAVHGNELIHLFVDPDQAGIGLGRRLLSAAEAHMSEDGHSMFELHTMVGNAPAIGLYVSAGWRVTDRLIHTADDHGVSYDEHVLAKHLA